MTGRLSSIVGVLCHASEKSGNTWSLVLIRWLVLRTAVGDD